MQIRWKNKADIAVELQLDPRQQINGNESRCMSHYLSFNCN